MMFRGNGQQGKVRAVPGRAALMAVLLVAVIATSPVDAQRGGAQAEAQKAISDLRSPYCPGLMLEVCPSPAAEALRDSIVELAETGLAAPALVEWMIARHGEEWRGTPKRSGAGLWAWLGPPAGLLIAVLVFLGMLRRMRGRTRPAAVTTEPRLSEAEQAELAAALREFEEQPEEV
jgi:cytochrome c-type biogenesis protein CcmH/NrfF